MRLSETKTLLLTPRPLRDLHPALDPLSYRRGLSATRSLLLPSLTYTLAERAAFARSCVWQVDMCNEDGWCALMFAAYNGAWRTVGLQRLTPRAGLATAPLPTPH